jgi:Protein of unknown function (DUF3570)
VGARSFIRVRLLRRPRVLRAALFLLVFFGSSSTGMLVAHAAVDKDAQATLAVQGILAGDVANANYGEARRKLKALLDHCKKAPACTNTTVGRVDIALGLIATQLGQTEDGRALFIEAVKLDYSSAALPANATPAAKALFAEAQKAAPPPAPPAPTFDIKNKDAADLAQTAVMAESNGLYEQCAEKSRASIAIEEQPRTQILLSGCLQKSGKLLLALGEAQKALQAGLQRRDIVLAKLAAAKVEEVLKKVAHILIIPPTTGGVTDLKVTFNNRPVPPAIISKQISIDPGQHMVRAEGMANGIKLVFEQTYDVKESDLVTVQITLKPESPKYLTEGQMQCMRAAKTQIDVAGCLPSGEKPLNVHVGLDMSAYGDTTATRVYSPSIRGGVASPTAGWNVAASYLVDIVTSASPDVVSTASRKFSDTRHSVALNGGFKPGRFGFDAAATYSAENDYISRSARVGILGDFADKRFTPRLGVGRVQDTLGRAGEGFDKFSTSFYSNNVDLSGSFVLTPTSVFVIGIAGEFERGDQSKPYRLIPMFDSLTNVPIGASVASVNANRLPVRPFEQLPLDRDRYSLAMRYVKRFGTSTLRLEERVYRDSWTILATTTDLRYIVELGTRMSVWPHVRAHAQTGANFYERVYHADIAPIVQVPTFRTTDRELSPFVALTLGGGARYELSPANARFRYALTLVGDVLGSRYLNAIYIRNRLAVYGTFGLEAQFE